MRLCFGIVLLLFFGGCAAYKELEPEPPVLPTELGYIELQEDGEYFELDKGSKYFVSFPSPAQNNFFLVLSTRSKSALKTSLTNRFEGEEEGIVRIPEADLSTDSVLVYPVDPSSPTFFWLIESVPYDLTLSLKYRYVPQWRYTFETRFSAYRDVLVTNTVDRSAYNSIDATYDTDKLDTQGELARVKEKNARVDAMMEELLDLEKVFPPAIESSGDTAYTSYAAFRDKTAEELAFQKTYGAALSLFQKEKETRGNPAGFLSAVPFFASTLSDGSRFSSGVNAKACQLMATRFDESVAYMDKVLLAKRDLAPISPAPPVDSVRSIHRACRQPLSTDTEQTFQFVSQFNKEALGIEASRKAVEDLNRYFNSAVGAPPDTFYTELVKRSGKLLDGVPRSQASRMPRYSNYACATLLAREVSNTVNTASDLQTVFRKSKTVAQQINDKSWEPAEAGLRELHETPLASSSPDVASNRRVLVESLEDDMFSRVKTASHARIDTFITKHANAIDNVPELYADSAFLPIYRISFSSRGTEGLARKQKEIDGYLDGIKHVQFPESSIKSIYASFTANVSDRGVEKARAIVEHGKFYQGKDQQVKNMIGECDVETPKLISSPRQYRKFYALPVSSNSSGENEYMFRLGLRIPSEAEFPVFDVNVKLPEEIAKRAGERQWYESMTINARALKNEGRFRITSPTADNNYEVLITPVQMDKGERNILEVRFRYPGFKVFEVSAMAQVPIIRKN